MRLARPIWLPAHARPPHVAASAASHPAPIPLVPTQPGVCVGAEAALHVDEPTSASHR
jgi:hypothetical protein